jgi:hypothetical protein
VGSFFQGLGPLLVCGALVFAPEPKLPDAVKKAVADGSMKLHRIQAGEPNAAGWYEAKSTDGHFRVMMPIPFNDFTTRNPENLQALPVACAIGSKSAEGWTFTVTEFPVRPPKPLMTDFDAARKDLVESTQKQPKNSLFARVYDVRHFDFDGHAAVELKISDKPNSAIIRQVFLKNRAYMMIVEYPIQDHLKVMPLATEMMDSLKIEAW